MADHIIMSKTFYVTSNYIHHVWLYLQVLANRVPDLLLYLLKVIFNNMQHPKNMLMDWNPIQGVFRPRAQCSQHGIQIYPDQYNRFSKDI